MPDLAYLTAQAHTLQSRLQRTNRRKPSQQDLDDIQRTNAIAWDRYEGLQPHEKSEVLIEGQAEDLAIYIPGEGFSSTQRERDHWLLVDVPEGIREIFVAGTGDFSLGEFLGIQQKKGNWYLFGGLVDLGSPEMPGAGTGVAWWVPDRFLHADMSPYYDYHDREYYGPDVTLSDVGEILDVEWNAFLRGATLDRLQLPLQLLYSGTTTGFGLLTALKNSATGALESLPTLSRAFDAMGGPGDLGLLGNLLGPNSPLGAKLGTDNPLFALAGKLGLVDGLLGAGPLGGGGAGGCFEVGSPASIIQALGGGGASSGEPAKPPPGGPGGGGSDGFLVTIGSGGGGGGAGAGAGTNANTSSGPKAGKAGAAAEGSGDQSGAQAGSGGDDEAGSVDSSGEYGGTGAPDTRPDQSAETPGSEDEGADDKPEVEPPAEETAATDQNPSYEPEPVPNPSSSAPNSPSEDNSPIEQNPRPNPELDEECGNLYWVKSPNYTYEIEYSGLRLDAPSGEWVTLAFKFSGRFAATVGCNSYGEPKTVDFDFPYSFVVGYRITGFEVALMMTPGLGLIKAAAKARTLIRGGLIYRKYRPYLEKAITVIEEGKEAICTRSFDYSDFREIFPRPPLPPGFI